RKAVSNSHIRRVCTSISSLIGRCVMAGYWERFAAEMRRPLTDDDAVDAWKDATRGPPLSPVFCPRCGHEPRECRCRSTKWDHHADHGPSQKEFNWGKRTKGDACQSTSTTTTKG